MAAAPRAPRIAIARLRDLALLPALVVLVIIGAVVSPVFLSPANITTILTSSAALALVVLAESLIIITGKFDLSLESTFGFAPAIGAMVVLPAANFGFGFELPTFVGILVVLVVGGLVGFLNGFMVVRPAPERLHRHAGDADHPARHAGRGDQRPDAFRPARRLLRADDRDPVRPAARGLARRARLRRRRPRPALPSSRPRALRDRRQSRGGARRRHPGRAHHLGRLRARRRPRRDRRPGDHRLCRGDQRQPGQRA